MKIGKNKTNLPKRGLNGNYCNSCLAVFSKIFKRVVYEKLRYYVEVNNLICNDKTWFKWFCKSVYWNALYTGEAVVGCFVDIISKFDSVNFYKRLVMEIINLKQFTKVLNQQSITNVGYDRVLFSAPVPFFLSTSVMMGRAGP